MNVLTVRRLESGDQHLCREMNMLFAREFDDAKTYTQNPPSEDYFQKLIGKPHIHALVALEAGEVVGALVGYELEKFEQERCEIYIYDLAVTEEKRRQGIATALIEHLKGIGRERNAWVLLSRPTMATIRPSGSITSSAPAKMSCTSILQ
jgi:aminoglycoside 3-N-acetyltransferase I